MNAIARMSTFAATAAPVLSARRAFQATLSTRGSFRCVLPRLAQPN
jgi:hypothetical protein